MLPIIESVVAIISRSSPTPVSQSLLTPPSSADDCTVGEVLGLISGGLILPARTSKIDGLCYPERLTSTMCGA